MGFTNKIWYTGLLVACLATAVIFCGGVKEPTAVQKPPLPDFSGPDVIATISNGDRVVTYNTFLDVVCIENASAGNPARFQQAAFSCWDTPTAPRKLKELVVKYQVAHNGVKQM